MRLLLQIHCNVSWIAFCVKPVHNICRAFLRRDMRHVCSKRDHVTLKNQWERFAANSARQIGIFPICRMLLVGSSVSRDLSCFPRVAWRVLCRKAQRHAFSDNKMQLLLPRFASRFPVPRLILFILCCLHYMRLVTVRLFVINLKITTCLIIDSGSIPVVPPIVWVVRRRSTSFC